MIDYEKYFNTTISSISGSVMLELQKQAEKYPDCITLGIGEPDFKTPYRIREAGIQSLERGRTWYTPGDGIMPLKKAIVAYQKRRFKLDYTTDEVMVTVGGSEGIDMFFRTMLNPGDEVILPTPCYVSYDPIAKMCGAKVVPIALKQENDFKIAQAGHISEKQDPRASISGKSYRSHPRGRGSSGHRRSHSGHRHLRHD